MSIIFDALKKIEEEKKKAKSQPAETVSEPSGVSFAEPVDVVRVKQVEAVSREPTASSAITLSLTKPMLFALVGLAAVVVVSVLAVTWIQGGEEAGSIPSTISREEQLGPSLASVPPVVPVRTPSPSPTEIPAQIPAQRPVAQPEVARPKVARPEVARPEVARPEVATQPPSAAIVETPLPTTVVRAPLQPVPFPEPPVAAISPPTEAITPPHLHIDMLRYKPPTSFPSQLSVAVVNRKRVFEGDSVEGCIVREIKKREIDFEFQGKTFTVRFGD